MRRRRRRGRRGYLCHVSFDPYALPFSLHFVAVHLSLSLALSGCLTNRIFKNRGPLSPRTKQLQLLSLYPLFALIQRKESTMQCIHRRIVTCWGQKNRSVWLGSKGLHGYLIHKPNGLIPKKIPILSSISIMF